MIDIIIFSYFCKMLRMNNKIIQSIFLSVMIGIFLVLSSLPQLAHNHDHTFNKTEKKDSHHQKYDDTHGCISCHFLSTGNAILPSDFIFEIQEISYFNTTFFKYYSLYKYNTELKFQSRAPPYQI